MPQIRFCYTGIISFPSRTSPFSIDRRPRELIFTLHTISIQTLSINEEEEEEEEEEFPPEKIALQANPVVGFWDGWWDT